MIPRDISPSNLRKQASEATKIPIGSLRLIFRGKIIGESGTTKAVEEFKLNADCVIHCMGKPQVSAAPAAEAAAASPAAAAAGSSVTIQPPSNAAAAPASANTLQTAFTTLRSSNPPQTYMTAVTTLDKILSNIISNPMEEKYRRVKKQNAAFQKRLGGLMGGDDALKAAGFVVEVDGAEEVYIMHASAEKWPALVVTKTAVEGAVREAQAAANQSSAPPMMMPGAGAGAAGMPNFGGLPGMGDGGMGGPGGMMGNPQMQQAAAQMMRDPQAMQAMLQNPMVQNMMRNDPRFANNPQMQQSLEQMANNPQMLQQLSQMMSDPNMQQQMQSMMGAGGGMGGAGGGMGGMPPFGGANPGAGNNANANSGAGQQQSGPNDQSQTEEEMIAEAIRRSLEEGGGGS